MKKSFNFIFCVFLSFTNSISSQNFTLEQVAKFSFPSKLISSESGKKIAWAMNEQGKRNVYFAEAPDFLPVKLTKFTEDDGQEISSLQFSPDDKFLVFVRGGDHGGGNSDRSVNPLHSIKIPKVNLWKINLKTKKTDTICEGDKPLIGTPHLLAFEKNEQIWTYNLSKGDPPKQLFETRYNIRSFQFSPNGQDLLFASDRGSHSFIGVLEKSSDKIKWLSPAFQKDVSPRWSPDGKSVVFIRTPGGEGAALPLLEKRHSPWEIWVAEVATGKAYQRWKAPETIRGSVPSVDGGFNLHWASNNKIIYLSYEDGWPHLYAMDAKHGDSKLLTPGKYLVEHVALSPDGKTLIFSANAGPEPEDVGRRHIGKVSVNGSEVNWKTSGKGIEAHPVFLGSDGTLAFLSATPKRPLLPAILKDRKIKLLGKEFIPEDFPQEELVEPTQVSFNAPDGTLIYGQLFQKKKSLEEKPGIVFVHGGPQRQMLLGWSYMDYYSNTYAVNQYLANLGFVVLSVNYRLGIGYGYEFHRPEGTYYQGAAEYQDIKAAGEFLAGLSIVNKEKIGIYGGSYGGYLTALALGKDPELFKVGVDIHGVHNFEGRYDLPEGYEVAPDYEEAKKIAWESSPLAYLENWSSPVLFIHGDDDRNVGISHTVDLIRRFEEKKIPYKYLMVPDETHHLMKYSNMILVDKAIVGFLKDFLLD